MPKVRMRFRPGDMDAAAPVIATLLDDFEAWGRERRPGVEVVDVSNLELLLDWKINYGDGRLDVWTVRELEEFMVGWCPRKVMVSEAQASEMPRSIADAFEFLGARGLLSRSSGAAASRLSAHALAISARFLTAMTDPANVGLARSIFGGSDLDLDEPLTPDRLDELVAEFNALPFDEREARTGGAFGLPEELPVIGPVRVPDDEAVRESAEAAPALAAFTALAEFFRTPGRPLTAKGNIRLADAEALSELLGTETRDEKIGARTFRRTSSAQMPHLDHWQWWAREVGALRVRNGRLVGVEAWLKRRAKDPVGEARKAFGILAEYGPVGSWIGEARGVQRLVDQMLAPLLAMLLSSREPVPFDRLVDAVEEAREMTGDRGWMPENADLRREESGWTLDRLLEIVERTGVLTQEGVRHEKVRRLERRVGGTVRLTPFGVVVAIDLVRESGPEVLTIGDPAAMTAADLAHLAIGREIDPTGWVNLVDEWAGTQPDRRGALREVVEGLADDEALVLVLALPMPPALLEDLAAVMRGLSEARGPEDELGAVAFTWLIEHGHLDVEQVPGEALFTSAVATLGLVAKGDPESVPEAMGLDHPREDHLSFVREASRRMPRNIEALLDAIGSHHPDPVVSKAARKELMRARSRGAHSRGR